MPRSAINLSSAKPLSAADRGANEAILHQLFTVEGFNERDGFKFRELPGAASQRSAELKDALGKIKVPGFNDAAITLSASDHIRIISESLAADGIQLGAEILAQNEESKRKLLFTLFRSYLTIDAYMREAEIIRGHACNQGDKTTALSSMASAIQANRTTISSFISKVRIEQRILKVVVPGNGDCFYHSVAIDLIHDVLTGAITQDSPTGQAFMKHAPKLAAQLARQGVQIDFNGKTLKQAILALLGAVQLNDADMSPLSADETEETRAIRQCDFYRLLTDVTAPVLREIMHDGLNQQKDQHAAAVKNVLGQEFAAFIRSEKGNELKLAEDRILAAKAQAAGGEFADMPQESKQPLHDSWTAFYAANKERALAAADKEDFINTLFEAWWNNGADTAFNLYSSLHVSKGVYAGMPQQQALAEQLQCNFAVLRQSDGQAVPITRNIPQGSTLLVCQRDMHFDAMVGKPDVVQPGAVTQAMHAAVITPRAAKAAGSKSERKESPKPRSGSQDSAVSNAIRNVIISRIEEGTLKHDEKNWTDLITKARNETGKPGSTVDYVLPGAEVIKVSRATQEALDEELAKKLQLEEYAGSRPASPQRR